MLLHRGKSGLSSGNAWELREGQNSQNLGEEKVGLLTGGI